MGQTPKARDENEKTGNACSIFKITKGFCASKMKFDFPAAHSFPLE
jgi:hypothetical protein